MAKSRVLLATGDEWIANLIGAVLRDAGLEVVESPTGAASLELLARDPVDAVVIDAALPDDAAEFVGLLRKSEGPAAAAAVMLLAHADDSFSRMEALRAGADACLGRPFRADELGLQVLALIAMAHRCADAPRPRGSFPSVATALRSPSLLPPSSDGAALVGDLAQVSLPTMLSLLELERRSGTMTVQTARQTVTLVMREGAAARATINGAATSIIAVLRRVLRWKVGRFEFRPDEPGPASVPPEEHSSIGALLIEAARLDDESPQSRRSSMLPPPPVDDADLTFDAHEAPTRPTLDDPPPPPASRRSLRPAAEPARPSARPAARPGTQPSARASTPPGARLSSPPAARRPPGTAAAPSTPPGARRPSKVPAKASKSPPASARTSKIPPIKVPALKVPTKIAPVTDAAPSTPRPPAAVTLVGVPVVAIERTRTAAPPAPAPAASPAASPIVSPAASPAVSPIVSPAASPAGAPPVASPGAGSPAVSPAAPRRLATPPPPSVPRPAATPAPPAAPRPAMASDPTPASPSTGSSPSLATPPPAGPPRPAPKPGGPPRPRGS